MSDELLVAEIHAASVRREQRSMLARTVRKTTLPVIAAAIVVVAWEIAVDASGIKPAVLPAPSGVLSATFANRDILIANALPTTLETIAGFILSLSLGGLLGVLLTYFALVRDGNLRRLAGVVPAGARAGDRPVRDHGAAPHQGRIAAR